MLPMITGPEEWDDVMQEVEHCKQQLESRGVEYDKDLHFGCLIEIPAAALAADQIMDHGAKFLAIDIDDLTRYTLAANTKDDAKRYGRPKPPAVRRLVNMVCRMGERPQGAGLYVRRKNQRAACHGNLPAGRHPRLLHGGGHPQRTQGKIHGAGPEPSTDAGRTG